MIAWMLGPSLVGIRVGRLEIWLRSWGSWWNVKAYRCFSKDMAKDVFCLNVSRLTISWSRRGETE